MPFFQKTDVRMLVSCAVLLVLFAAVAWGVAQCGGEGGTPPLPSPADVERVQALERRLQTDSARFSKSARGGIVQAALFPFDPNRADSLTLLRLGFRPWQVGNMLKYRRAGGVWRTPEALRRLYGLSEADFRRLLPYIRIAAGGFKENASASSSPSERPVYERIEKYAEGTLIPLNEADTTELKRIPGIGSYYARKIVAYRERLGGFIKAEQVDEIDGDMPANLSRWFTVEPDFMPRRIRINRATFKQLVRHPYLSYEQTKSIVNYIRVHGPLRRWSDLRLDTAFTADDFRRLAPYFSFE